MILPDTENIKKALHKAKEVSDYYANECRSGNCDKRDVEELVCLARDYFNKNVSVFILNSVPQSARSRSVSDYGIHAFYVANRDKSYEIYCYPNMPEESQRFAITKEVFHMMLDEEQYRTTNIYSHLANAAGPFADEDNQMSLPMESEVMAEIAAIEFLYPFERRLKDYENPDIDAICDHYGLPRYKVEQYLTEVTMTALKDSHCSIDGTLSFCSAKKIA
jgi:Zn-dependent peptidase ImmA (M78 family)